MSSGAYTSPCHDDPWPSLSEQLAGTQTLLCSDFGKDSSRKERSCFGPESFIARTSTATILRQNSSHGGKHKFGANPAVALKTFCDFQGSNLKVAKSYSHVPVDWLDGNRLQALAFGGRDCHEGQIRISIEILLDQAVARVPGPPRIMKVGT